MSSVGEFLFSYCAYGARFCYGTLSFFVGISTLLIGFRQICLARTILSIVQSGDLVAEDMRKKSNRMFTGLIVSLCVFYAAFLGTTLQKTDGKMIVQQMCAYYVASLFFTLSGLLLYLYTIMMLRKSIALCSSFKFESRGTYLICGIYLVIACLQLVYVMTYEYVNNVIVYITLVHFGGYFLLQVAIYFMLLRTGSGLKLVPHKLKNNWLQFEGYDSSGKHLFTFTLNDHKTEVAKGTKVVSLRTRSESSEFSGDEDFSKVEITNVESQLDLTERLTEYDAAEKLLNLQQLFQSWTRFGATHSASLSHSLYRPSSLAFPKNIDSVARLNNSDKLICKQC